MKMSKTVRSINLRKLKKPAALCISILFIISIFAISATRADSGGTIIFSSGFEDGFNSWTSTNGGVSVVSSPVYSGNYAMRAEYWGSQATESVGSQSETYTSAEFYLDRNLAGSQSLIAYFDANSHATVAMGLSVQSGSAYAFVQTIFPSYRYQQYNLTSLPMGVWYKFALDVSSDSAATIFLNDKHLTSINSGNFPATAMVSMGMFWGDGSYTGNLYIDNVQISTSSSTSTPTPTPTPTPSPTPTPTGTSLFSSGFEDGFNSWTSTSGGVHIVSSPVYSGNYAMRAEYWGSQATESVGSQSEVYTSAEFYLDRNLAGSQSLIAYFDANSHATVAMGLSVQSGSAYAFVQTIFPGYRYQQYNLTNLPPAVWYKFALDVSATSATIYLNDQQLTSLSQTNIPATASVSVGMFWGDGSYTGNLYVDNVQIGTSAGGNPTSTPTPTPTPTPSPTPTLSGTSIFSSGFENGFASWTATQGGVSIVTSPVYSGNYAMKAEYWGSRAIESIGTESETYTEAEFYFDQTLAGSQSLIAYFDGSGYATVAMGLSVQSGRVLVFVQTILPSYGYRQYELTGVTPGTWYKFALDASATSATIYMNDQKLASINQTNIPATASVSVGILYEDGVYTGNLYVDNVQISSPSPEPTWSQTYGGTGISYGQSVVRTADGGYAVTGGTNSFGNYNGDIYLVKTSSTGIPQWNQTYGGVGYSVIQTSDGGYAIAGETSSFGVYDQVYLVKTDSAGTMLWNKAYGGTSSAGYSVIQTSDGGYAIAGYTYSYGSGMGDVYLVKTDSSGNLLWNKTYGGTGDDGGQSVVQTSDGGYAIAGYTGSFGAGGLDVYLVKTDSAGTMLWNKAYGGINYDGGQSVVQTSDGGYAIAGYTESFGAGGLDVYLVKTDSSGNLLWNKTYGGTGDDGGQSVVQTPDGGYAIAGYTESFGAGGLDVYLVKTDASGNLLWNKTYGGTGDDVGYSVVQSSDGGYAIAGYTSPQHERSPPRPTNYGNNVINVYLVKTDVNGNLG